jgi:hypothetical protein
MDRPYATLGKPGTESPPTPATDYLQYGRRIQYRQLCFGSCFRMCYTRNLNSYMKDGDASSITVLYTPVSIYSFLTISSLWCNEGISIFKP